MICMKDSFTQLPFVESWDCFTLSFCSLFKTELYYFLFLFKNNFSLSLVVSIFSVEVTHSLYWTHYFHLSLSLIHSAISQNDSRNYSLEKKSFDKERGSTSGPGSFAGSGTSIPKKGKDSKFPSRKTSLNIFERLRQGKQDKIAADVQRKIRAVRAAEDLDRRVNAKRSE